MTKPLPENPSLENLKKQAKTLQKIRASGKLADCQLAIAREYGFASWAQLKVAVEAANRDLADQFVSLACLCHDDPHYDHRSFQARAQAMLRDHPAIAEANIWAASAAGNANTIRAFLDREPDLLNRRGPFGWTPLICVCYSRVKPSTFEAAKLLLDRGADPNAFTTKGNTDERLDQTPRRFTALTGVFGGGSTGLANQPPHPHWRELAELLLERGAHPADEMALAINREASLDMLLRHGLKPDAMGSGGITILGRELCVAARQGNRERVERLLENSARTDERFDGKTAWRHATDRGHREIARVLELAGAPVDTLSDVDQFVSLCLAGAEQGVRAMLDRSPGLLTQAPKSLVHMAVGAENMAAVRLALDLGFDPNEIDDNAALHMTGQMAKNPEILELLLKRGGSLKLRDPWYDSTPIGWADFFNEIELRDHLLARDGICLLDALEYGRFDRVPEILATDLDALERPFAKELSREPKPEDWRTPLATMVMRGNLEAAGELLRHGANRLTTQPDGRTLMQVAHDKGFAAIEELLAKASV